MLLSAGFCQEAKVKKIMSKKERREKKMFSSKDDEHFLLTGVKLADRRGWGDTHDNPAVDNCFPAAPQSNFIKTKPPTV